MRKLKLLIAACMVTVAASASKTVYFQPNSNWAGNTTRYSLYLYTGENAGPWLDFTAVGDGTYTTTIGDEQESWERMIFVAMNPNTTANDWDNKWNESNNFAVPTVSGLLYTQADGWDKMDCSISIYGATAASFTDGGKYIFKNVGSGRYFGPSNSWGSQASLIQPSHFNTVHYQQDGVYTIESQVCPNGGNNYYFSGTYMDSDNAAWLKIQQISEGIYVIAPSDNVMSYYGYDGTNTVLASGLTDYNNVNAQWQIVSYDDALANASETTPVDASFMVLAQNFDRGHRSANAWTITFPGGENKNLSGGANENRCAESYGVAFTLSQTITVPNGYYGIKAQGFYRNDGGAIQDAPAVYANDATTPLPLISRDAASITQNLYGNSTYSGQNPNNMNAASGAFTENLYWTDEARLTVTNKSITLGVKNTNNSLWCIWDNIQLVYYGPIDLSGYATTLAEAVAAAEATQGTIPTAAYNEIAAVVADKNKTYDNEDDYLAAINAINTAIATYAYDNIVAAYARYKRIKAAVLAINASIDVTDADAAAEAATTNTAVDNAVPTLRGALTAYLATVEDEEIDLTAAMIDNPAPGTAGKTDYWTNTTNPGLQYNLYEFYNVEATTKQQLAPLPAGYYKMTVVGYTREGNGAYLFADGNTHPLVQVAKGTVNDREHGDAWIAQGNGVNEFIFQLENDEHDLEIGIYTSNTANNDKWTCWRSFKLEFMGSAPVSVFQTELAAAVTAANDHATALGTTIPEGAMTAYTNAISTAAATNTTVADCKKSIEDIQAATTAADAFVAPYAAYLAVQTHVQALYDAAYEELTTGSHETLGNALTAAATSLAATTIATTDIAGIASTLKAAGVTYAGAANPIGSSKFDLTFMLTNPDVTAFTNWQGVEGWYTDQPDGNSQKMTNNDVTSEDGTKTAFFEYWSEAAKANNEFTLYQKVTLSAGTYAISCYAFASPNNVAGATDSQVYFYANETQGSRVTTEKLTEQGIEFVNNAEKEVKIGLKALTGNQYRWMGIGYVELYKVPAKSYTVDETVAWDNTIAGAGDVALKRTIKEGVNTLVLPFSMTQAEVESNFGEGSKVYVVNKFENDNISFAIHEGISANLPCLLKATVAGTSYTLADRTVVAGDPVATGTNVTMTGTYAASLTVDNGNYIISNKSGEPKIYLVDSSVTLKNTRAYITLPTSSARTLTMSFDDGTTTGIATLENGELKVETGIIYDLQGRKVNNPAKGLYIINGKKVIK